MKIEDFFTKERYTGTELRLIIEAIPANVFYKDTQCRYQLASHVCKMLNGEEGDYTIIGKTDLEIQVESDLGRRYYEEDLDLIENGGEKRYISEMHFGDETYYYEISKKTMHDARGNVSGIVGMVTDMTELIKLQKELERLSTRDMLTGCFNRTFLERRKAEGIDGESLPLSVIMSDCDGLKRINDTYGHTAGDEYLYKVVETIRDRVPSRSEIIRLGGDEFLTIISSCGAETCKALIKSICEEAAGKTVEGIPISSSFGSATITSSGQSLSEAMAQADAEMYAAKQLSKRSVSR